MALITTFLLFFVSVGVVKTQDFQFPPDDVSHSYPNLRVSLANANAVSNNYHGRFDANTNANAKLYFGFGESTSNADTKIDGDNRRYPDSYSKTETYGYGGPARSKSNSGGTQGGYGYSKSDAQAHTFLDQHGNALLHLSSHSHSGYGNSNAASASATTGINQFGKPVAAVATGTASAGPNGHSSAMSFVTVSGGKNYLRFY